MLTEILDLSSINETVFDYLYDFFKRDFITNKTYLSEKIYINPRSHIKEDGKEKDFWHLITRDIDFAFCSEKKRVLDMRRAERIEWIKLIIDNYKSDEIKIFYYMEEPQKKIRLYLWAYMHDFVVILQKLGNKDTYLVTSFYINYEKKKKDFEKRYFDYINKKDIKLKDCEWF